MMDRIGWRALGLPDGEGTECPGYSGYSFGLRITSAGAETELLKAGELPALGEINPGPGALVKRL